MKTCIHVIHSLEYGGAQKDLYYYAKFHDRDRYRMEVVSFHPGGDMLPEIEALGIDVHTLGTRSSDPRSITRLVKIFSEQNADIVHFHNSLPIFSGVPAAVLARVPAKLMTEHSIYYPGKAGGSLSTSMYFNLRRRLDMVIACSEEVRESHQPELDSARTVTIVNGVDLSHFKLSSGKAGDAPVTFNIGSIGSLTRQKGYSNLVQAVKILADRNVPVKLTFVGDGPLRKELEQQVAESGLVDRMTFAGTTNDVMQVLPSFDVVAGSSLREGLPLSILEAMAAGLPVVTTDVGGNREAVINGTTGLLVPAGDPTALAEALESLWKDGGKRNSMGIAGRQRVEEYFSAENMVTGTEKVYESIMEGRS